MARVWVLDTETKGTGAHMVPLEQTLEKPAPRNEPIFVPPRPTPREPKPPEPRAPRRFKIVDIVTQQVLAEGAGAREAVEVLDDVRSIVDVHVSVWEPKTDRWRLLTLAEQRLLWDRRVLKRGYGAILARVIRSPRPAADPLRAARGRASSRGTRRAGRRPPADPGPARSRA